ncbi:MAG: PIG-L family deacetylase [Acidobacteriota bacterium]
MSDFVDALYLSPHLDDAILSCGGQMAAAVARGERVRVVTVFAGDPVGEPTPTARRLHEAMGLGDDAAARRREEDRAAGARLGVEVEQWDLPDALYRRDADGGPLIHDLRHVFDPRQRLDLILHKRIARRLCDLPVAGRLVAPLAIGGHLDHRAVRHAAEAIFGHQLRLYEDVPYARRGRARRRVLGWSALSRKRRAWRLERLEVPREVQDAVLAAVDCYITQVPLLFGSSDAMRRTFRRRWRRLGGERLWRRRA